MRILFPRICWYVFLLSLAGAALFFPNEFMRSVVASMVFFLVPTSISLQVVEPLLCGFGYIESCEKTFGVPTKTLAYLILAHGVFLMLVYLFTRDVLVAKIGWVLLFSGIEVLLFYSESKALLSPRSSDIGDTDRGAL